MTIQFTYLLSEPRLSYRKGSETCRTGRTSVHFCLGSHLPGRCTAPRPCSSGNSGGFLAGWPRCCFCCCCACHGGAVMGVEELAAAVVQSVTWFI